MKEKTNKKKQQKKQKKNKHFVKIVTSLVAVLLKMASCHVFILHLQRTHYYKPILN